MLQNYKYCIHPAELKEIRKLIIGDLRDYPREKGMSYAEQYADSPDKIHNMTLRMYFDIIKEAMLAVTDENGFVTGPDGYPWKGDRSKDIRQQSSIDVAREWMDGRGLFTEHFNGSRYSSTKDYGNWENIGQHEQNQWYHEDRLDDTAWFKQCTQCSIGAGGHPCETIGGSLYPVLLENDNWVLIYGIFARASYYMLKAYHHLRKQGIPVYIDGCEAYLTPKQREKIGL